MASYQYVYHMDGVSKAYPGGKKCFENIRLNFLPGVKIGVVGVNGAGKSTLLRIMAGIDKDFQGEAWAAKGAKVGYLPQEPHLDETKTVRENVMLGVAEKTALVEEYNAIAMKIAEDYTDELMEKMTLGEALEKYGEQLLIAATGAIAKKGSEPGGEVRVIFDGTNGVFLKTYVERTTMQTMSPWKPTARAFASDGFYSGSWRRTEEI